MKLTKYQKIIYEVFKKTDKDINISAVAGSGKTTVLLELLKFIPENSKALFLAFNNSIVNELKDRNEKEGVKIMTLHSCGWRLILQRYGNMKMNPNKGLAKTEKVLKELKIPEKRKGYFYYSVPKILDLMRCNITPNVKEEIIKLTNHYNIDIEEDDIEIVIKSFKYLMQDKTQFDFMDMIYVPVMDTSIRFKKFDYVFCDESQDFSLIQHKFIKNCINRRTGRLVTVGDPRQAIYGFAGADEDSYNKLANINNKAIKLPLSVCYRCAKNIVKEAQKVVPEISWTPDAEEGIVRNGSLTEIKEGDWILCRNLKPLVQTYLWLMKNKIKSKIRGKEIGEGILRLIDKTRAKTISGLDNALEKEVDDLLIKLEKKGVKKPSLHPRMEILQQKIEVIRCLSLEIKTISGLKKLIEGIFSDAVKGILLSTIHKSKGLENNRIFFLAPELIPSKYTTQPWQYKQEDNLKYVAITRAKKELIYVWGVTLVDDLTNKVTLNK